MCGIASIVRTDNQPASGRVLHGMLNLISYRGPDEAGYALIDRETIAFGQVRLSIIDVGAGPQPMWDATGELCIIFNGEIYDHANLRAELERDGQVFRTLTDTEVILGLYRRYGMAMFDHLNGEFAFIIWDDRKKQLLAARDRHGIKPLFWHQDGGAIYFCSEAKGILSVPGVERRINPKYITGAMVGAWPADTSTFAGINALKPGHFLFLDDKKALHEKRYWSQTYAPDPRMSFEDAKEGIRHHLRKAVKRRLVADVPVCMYLSGGVDSSLVAAMALNQGQRLKCFTLGFSRSIFDETQKARRTAEYFGTPFESVPCSNEDIAANFSKAMFHTETCIGNAGVVGKVVLSRRLRRNGYKVAMTGEGADELFGGYAYFKLELVRQMLLSGSWMERMRARKLIKRFEVLEKRSEGSFWSKGNLWRKIPQPYGYPSFLYTRAVQHARLLPTLLQPDILKQTDLPDAQFLKNFPPATLANMHQTHASLRMTLNFLSGYILTNLADRLEMANSIEGRPPFLDYELATFAGTIPPEHLINVQKLREKYVLYEAYASTIPPEVREDHKHPFVSQSWGALARTKEGARLFEQHLSQKAVEEAGIFAYKQVAKIKFLLSSLPPSSFLSKRVDTITGLIMSVQVLTDLFIKSRPASNTVVKIRKLVATPLPHVAA